MRHLTLLLLIGGPVLHSAGTPSPILQGQEKVEAPSKYLQPPEFSFPDPTKKNSYYRGSWIESVIQKNGRTIINLNVGKYGPHSRMGVHYRTKFELNAPNDPDSLVIIQKDGKTRKLIAINGKLTSLYSHTEKMGSSIQLDFEQVDLNQPFSMKEPTKISRWFERVDNDGSNRIFGRDDVRWDFVSVDKSKEYSELMIANAEGVAKYYKYLKEYNDCKTHRDFDLFIARYHGYEDQDRNSEALKKRESLFNPLLLSSSLTVRTGFKQGKIGERYTPDIKYYTSSSDTFTVNNQNYTVTKGDTNYSSGWKEGIEGYTAIWGVKNSSSKPYVVEVAVSGSSTYNPMVKKENMWGGEQRRTRITQRNSIRLVKRIFLMPGMDFKDQMVVGEAQPSDFKVEVQDFWPLDSAWVSNFEKAMGTELRNRATAKAVKPLLERLKQDPIATAPNAWGSDITSRLATADRVIHEADLRDMRRDLDVNVSAGSDFDPDFFSEVSVVVHNRSAYRYEVTLKKPDGNTETLTVEPRSTASSRVKVQRIAKSDLRAEILDIVAPADRVFMDAPESAVKQPSTVAPTKKSVGKKK